MFFDKFAKLKSNVDSDGTGFTVSVYDDEVSTEKPIMWLAANVSNARDRLKTFVAMGLIGNDTKVELEEKYNTIVFVNMVETDSSIYFELPENRRNTCATSLFKRFILHYKQNFDGELVSANFANYDLQEKFKVAVDKGIFPKDSLKIIGETSKEDYDSSVDYNINNKEKAYNMLKEIATVLGDKGLDAYVEGDNVYIKNSPVMDLSREVDSLISVLTDRYQEFELNKLANIEGNLDASGDYIFTIPIGMFKSYDNELFYDSVNTRVIIYDNLVDRVLQNESRFREIFSEAAFILVAGNHDEEIFTVDAFFQKNQVVSSKIKRMIKRSE